MGPYAGVDYNLTLCALQSRLQHIYQATHARVDLKGIDLPFRRGVKGSLIRSLFINWRLGNFFLLILKGFHHKISKKPIDAA